jgi:hypothetical protein
MKQNGKFPLQIQWVIIFHGFPGNFEISSSTLLILALGTSVFVLIFSELPPQLPFF